jgi:hypothetical protein
MTKQKLSIASKASPIEVWLTQGNLAITCRVVFEDETTDGLDVDAVSMRGAQREITGWLIDQGYTPVARWTTESASEDNDVLETSRQFRITRSKLEDDVAQVLEKAR